MSNPIFYPNVTSIPGSTPGLDRGPRKSEGAPGEFGQVLDRSLDRAAGAEVKGEVSKAGAADLNQVKAPLKFSAHAMQRLNDRKISIDQGTMARVSEAVDKCDAKGVDDTLVLTKDVALIVSVKNRTVITAMDRGSMNGNVFTNIDGAVIV